MNRNRINRHSDNGNNKVVVTAIVAGVVIGAALSYLFASKKGSKMRNMIADNANDWASCVTDGFQSVKEKLSSGAGELSNKAKNKYSDLKSQTENLVDGAKNGYNSVKNKI